MIRAALSSLALLAVLAGTVAGQAASGTARVYSLLPGDAVKVQIWQEPDLSGTFRVAEDTTLSLPMIGKVPTMSLSPEELRARLVQQYSAQLKNPSIEVSVLRRVSVIGQVANPGLIDVEPSMRVGDVLALVGGTTPQGNQDNVDILRGNVKVVEDLRPGDVVGNRVQAGDQVLVNEKSWMSQNGAKIAVGLAGAVTAVMLRAIVFN